jgi:hypothetical protein
MGFFSKALGSADDGILANGILGRGEITSISVHSMTMRVNNSLVERKCTIAMNVMIDNTPAFPVTVVQRIREVYLPQLGQNAAVPVRVDPDDHSKVFIDFASQIPTITLPRSTGPDSASSILGNGKPVKVILVASQPLKLKNADGIDIQALTLTVYEGVETPYQVQVGNPVPATALPLLYPGSKLHARLGAGPNNVVVDWAAGAAT